MSKGILGHTKSVHLWLENKRGLVPDGTMGRVVKCWCYFYGMPNGILGCVVQFFGLLIWHT